MASVPPDPPLSGAPNGKTPQFAGVCFAVTFSGEFVASHLRRPPARPLPSCPSRLLSLKARTIRSRRTSERPPLLRQDSRGCWKLTRPGAMSQSRLTRSWFFDFLHGGVDGQTHS